MDDWPQPWFSDAMGELPSQAREQLQRAFEAEDRAWELAKADREGFLEHLKILQAEVNLLITLGRVTLPWDRAGR